MVKHFYVICHSTLVSCIRNHLVADLFKGRYVSGTLLEVSFLYWW